MQPVNKVITAHSWEVVFKLRMNMNIIRFIKQLSGKLRECEKFYDFVTFEMCVFVDFDLGRVIAGLASVSCHLKESDKFL